MGRTHNAIDAEARIRGLGQDVCAEEGRVVVMYNTTRAGWACTLESTNTASIRRVDIYLWRLHDRRGERHFPPPAFVSIICKRIFDPPPRQAFGYNLSSHQPQWNRPIHSRIQRVRQVVTCRPDVSPWHLQIPSASTSSPREPEYTLAAYPPSHRSDPSQQNPPASR